MLNVERQTYANLGLRLYHRLIWLKFLIHKNRHLEFARIYNKTYVIIIDEYRWLVRKI
jgi:hypothetical protein